MSQIPLEIQLPGYLLLCETLIIFYEQSQVKFAKERAYPASLLAIYGFSKLWPILAESEMLILLYHPFLRPGTYIFMEFEGQKWPSTLTDVSEPKDHFWLMYILQKANRHFLALLFSVVNVKPVLSLKCEFCLPFPVRILIPTKTILSEQDFPFLEVSISKI